MMPTRHIHLILQFFAVAFLAALTVVIVAPISAIRVLGFMALFFAGCGLALQLFELHREDAHAFTVLRYRLLAPFEWAKGGLARLTGRVGHTAMTSPQ